jgi:hypothetical protein
VILYPQPATVINGEPAYLQFALTLTLRTMDESYMYKPEDVYGLD